MTSPPLAGNDEQRYARHLALAEVGPSGQAKLKAAAVLIVGAGGLGSPAALYLAAAGVGRLGLVDFDQVELSNLQRQILFGTADLGHNKAATARDRLLALNPTIQVVAHQARLGADNLREIFAPYDVIVDGTDRLATRYLVNDACVLLRKPLVTAAIHRFEGQAMTYVPGKGPCYRCLFPDSAEGLVPNCAEAGVLGVLPGVMGSLQATEAIKLILGLGEALIGRLMVYDALALRFQEFRFQRRADCAVCGDNPRIIDLAATGEPALTSIANWTPLELAAQLKGANAARLQLVDVREPQEWIAGRLPGSVHVPLATLPQRLAELPAGKTLVFICAAGGRSMAACRFAAQAGRETANLDGGLHAWTAQIGPPPLP